MAQAVLDFSRAAGKARAVGARRRNGLALRTLAWQARWRGDFDAAESLAHRAIARLKGEGAESAIADSLATLAVVHYCRGRRDLARDCLDEGFEVLEHQPNVASRIDLLTTQAAVERHGQRMRIVQAAMREAVALSAGVERARTEHSVARALLQDDRPGEALEHANMAIELAREYQNRVIEPYALEVAATAQIDLDQIEDAERLLREAEAIAERDADARAACHLLFQRVRLARRRGDRDGALALARAGEEKARTIGYPLWEKNFLDRAALLQEELGQTDTALRTLKRLLALRDAERD